jgi:hypothetical protein
LNLGKDLLCQQLSLLQLQSPRVPHHHIT